MSYEVIHEGFSKVLNKSTLTVISAVLLFTGCSQETEETTPTASTAQSAAPAASTAAADGAAVDAAIAALGMEDLDSITYSGTAWRIRNSFMQTPSASPPWP